MQFAIKVSCNKEKEGIEQDGRNFQAHTRTTHDTKCQQAPPGDL